MDANTLINMTKKLNNGFRTKKDKIVSLSINKELGLATILIKNNDLGLFICNLESDNIDVDKEDINNLLKKGFGNYGFHGGNGDAVIDLWYETELGKLSIIAIPNIELTVYPRKIF